MEQFGSTRAEAAFGELVHRHTNFLYSIAKRRVADVSLALEVTQIVFIRLAKTPPKLDSEERLLRWGQGQTGKVTPQAWIGLKGATAAART